jgi:magnesium-transporting ATPase (P-type)
MIFDKTGTLTEGVFTVRSCSPIGNNDIARVAGLAAALESLKQQQDQEKEVNCLIKVMQRASTAAAPAFMPIAKIAMSFTNIF